jgi:hypothetical protein
MKTFRDPNASNDRKLRALYIIDKNNAVSLISNNDGITEIATIDFLTPKISYQKAFPPIQVMTSAVFSSPTVYYAGGHHTKFYIDQSNYQFINLTQAFVYSSD